MTPINGEIEVKNLDHLGLVAGIIDELGIVEIINEQADEILTASSRTTISRKRICLLKRPLIFC